MKARLVIAAVTAMTLQLPTMGAADVQTVTIYVENRLAPKDDFAARRQVQQMFATAGVRIVWRDGAPSSAEISLEHPIIVHFVLHTPVSDHPGALAFALPYEGMHLRIFYDRVQYANPRWTQAVLVHVLVHEITHLLQGMDRHSETGVMKAHWTAEDYRVMTWRPLSFTAHDIELIHAGLQARNAHDAGLTLDESGCCQQRG